MGLYNKNRSHIGYGFFYIVGRTAKWLSKNDPTLTNTGMNTQQKRVQRLLLWPPGFIWYMARKLPSVLFWGIRVLQLNANHCRTQLPFSWRTKNPFRSIYFSALCGAAELASGALCLFHTSGTGSYSMLVTEFEAEFIKKATQTVTMECREGNRIHEALQALKQPGDSCQISLAVSGLHPDGETLARFRVTWSFKRRHP
ncbi:Acyl-coenzyme A thioesterase PaaI, contains HGG motif [Cyclobacterium xiamenense]|uniref:Acyl-coenzyme A thioesterase PaaI, contains HGG motif n=1 Tax=Cyclobacterium xiamenense TaxID=1297121 RepID=A0A1H6ZMU9_9BACT|nr:Acyl-coenzyme A thioesterase PaaI, contains HGG motif [Cyclobacterium xiamenense]